MPNKNEQVYEVESLDLKIKGLTGYAIRLKLAKNQKGAERRMLVISLVFFALSIYFFARAAGVL